MASDDDSDTPEWLPEHQRHQPVLPILQPDTSKVKPSAIESAS